MPLHLSHIKGSSPPKFSQFQSYSFSFLSPFSLFQLSLYSAWYKFLLFTLRSYSIVELFFWFTLNNLFCSPLLLLTLFCNGVLLQLLFQSRSIHIKLPLLCTEISIAFSLPVFISAWASNVFREHITPYLYYFLPLWIFYFITPFISFLLDIKTDNLWFNNICSLDQIS